MKSLRIVTFLTDFGLSGGYVAACEATIVRISRDARVLHISHDVPVGDISAGSLVLARVAPLYPEAVHLAVVDPGVGTARLPVAVSTVRGDYLVGPDNGLLLDAAAALGGLQDAWTLDAVQVRTLAGLPLGGVSSTFHGRDLFAPASALLAAGIDPGSLGDPLDPASLVRLDPPSVAHSVDAVTAPVIEVDRFGNVGLGVHFEDLLPPDRQGSAITSFSVEIRGDGAPEWTARLVNAYGELRAGELGLIRDSWGQAALALNGASAAQCLGVGTGVMVTLTAQDAPADEA